MIILSLRAGAACEPGWAQDANVSQDAQHQDCDYQGSVAHCVHHLEEAGN
ncbi:MAG: hypothetical protein JF604_14925 [Bradyrhizobium sp.]|nr:hypothetical protein [Bradyrhizobium sp.]